MYKHNTYVTCIISQGTKPAAIVSEFKTLKSLFMNALIHLMLEKLVARKLYNSQLAQGTCNARLPCFLVQVFFYLVQVP